MNKMTQEPASQALSDTDVREEQVYFTLDMSAVPGLVANLIDYRCLMNFGRSLGYTYCHTRLMSSRHLFPHHPPRWVEKVRFFKRTWYWSFVVFDYVTIRIFSRNVYDFLGLNQCFASCRTILGGNRFPKNLRYRITLSDQFLQENNLSSYAALERHMKTLVSQRKKAGLPLLLVFKYAFPWDRVKRIIHAIPDIDPPDFRAAYFQRRKKHPFKSRFACGRLKTIAHLRLGDRATAYTPWGTWIQRLKVVNWRQSQSAQGCLGITVADFHQFMRGLLGHLPPDTIDAQIFSDGFRRTVKDVCEQGLIDPPLGLPERRLLRKGLKHQGRLLRQLLKGLPNSTCFIGEKESQLFRLIHAAIEADLVITAFPVQHLLLTRLLYFYRTQGPKPVVLLLHKPDAMSANGVLTARRKAGFLAWFSARGMLRVHFVDISAPDFPALAQQIMRQWKSGTRTIDRN